jgi:hypothetical protein
MIPISSSGVFSSGVFSCGVVGVVPGESVRRRALDQCRRLPGLGDHLGKYA